MGHHTELGNTHMHAVTPRNTIGSHNNNKIVTLGMIYRSSFHSVNLPSFFLLFSKNAYMFATSISC